MGISRDSTHKKRSTGGLMPVHRKKRAQQKGRPQSMTKLTTKSNILEEKKRVRSIRVRGGGIKQRALRLFEGNFSWGTYSITRKTKILDVKYNATNNELVKTNTLVKNSIVEIDSTPFKEWFKLKCGLDIGPKKQDPVTHNNSSNKNDSKSNANELTIEKNILEQFQHQRVLACITSRPGQSGRADGYILEGKELEFYIKKLQSKKK
ncbi:40S ribosomal protein S8-2 (macronuclear) [Tetrahymena thermophila SB210]|uniref:40S ribosomal protein S8 n=1 Tax=Tetrahymena thermophila (strain SB210) TaxID=312017 RepID=Q230V7_TETTS|nr:40S ribosomal protein S8-2 [Tetrahymena thermophila SB210]EAR91182.1 40S ribosomal protein S8-2 [Tetrahymena thermophila SB210]|eukprot:XP_001011427.1 40S ribosomal protein S8-2 [Tetrahymena thermophila SB210]